MKNFPRGTQIPVKKIQEQYMRVTKKAVTNGILEIKKYKDFEIANVGFMKFECAIQYGCNYNKFNSRKFSIVSSILYSGYLSIFTTRIMWLVGRSSKIFFVEFIFLSSLT